MREIPLSKGKVALVDDGDFERLSAFRWHAIHRGNSWHAARSEKRNKRRRTIYMHHAVIGDPAPGEQVDHVNRNGLDNQLENLRFASKRQNAQNRVQSNNGTKSSAYHGVSLHPRGNRWRANICAGTRKENGHAGQLYIGQFKTELDAAVAYDRAAIKHFGEFAVTNFPRENYSGTNI